MKNMKRLGIVGVVLVTVLLSLARPVGAVDAGWTPEDAAHLLRRAAFGGTPAQIDALHAMGRDAAVEYLLSGKLPAGAEPVFEPVKLAEFGLEPIDRGNGKDARKEALRNSRIELQRYRAYWVERMLKTDRPLEEKLTLFWHGLLTSGLQEVKFGHFLIDQNRLFHKHALGNYRALMGEILHDAAMLRYLDADKNVVGKPNENLARELMELFTMGEGQGYTEKDIAEVARALTGLAVNQYQGATFRRNKHDAGTKIIFGRTGRYGPDDVVGLIFERPQPPRYLAKKLWEFFGHMNPMPEEVTPVAEALRKNQFEVKAGLRALFTNPAFYGEKSKFALIKSPVELTVGTMRLLEQAPVALPIAQGVGRMGQELFQPPNVRGWPGGEQWITAATLYTRYNACAAMVEGDLRGFGTGMRERPAKPRAEVKKPAAAGTDRVGLGGRMAARLGDLRRTGAGVGSALAQAPALQDARERRREAVRERLGEQRIGRRLDDRPAPVSPAALFPGLGASPSKEQVVDAAIERFLQRPLHPEKRSALVEALGDGALKMGTRESDQRVRDMLSLLLSTPEYQVH